MSKKKILIFFKPSKFRDHDNIRFEIKNYSKKISVNYVEIFDLLYNNKIKLFKNSKSNYVKIISLSNFSQILKYLNNIIKKYEQVYLMNFIPLDNYNCLIVNLLIYTFYKKKIKIIKVSNSGFPSTLVKNYFFFLLTNFRFKQIFEKLNARIASYFFSLLNYKANYYLVSGKKEINYFKFLNLKPIIKFNTWDNSNLKLYNKNTINKKNIVFIDGAGPKTVSDREFFSQKESLTNEVWYRDLNIFFSKLENFFKCKVLIANHPLTKFKKYPKHFYGRETFSNQTLELVTKSKFIMTRQSTAIAYALNYKKPIMFIYSNENKDDYYNFSISKNLSNLLGTYPININEKFDKEKIFKCIKLNNKKYTLFSKNYISDRKDLICNSTILNNLINAE